jgi:hypothetical protein
MMALATTQPLPELPTALQTDDIKIGGKSARELQALAWYATQCWASSMLPTHIDSPQKAFFILCKGDELGLPPTSSWDLLYPTKAGRVGIMKKGALAVVQSKPSFGGYEERIEGEGTPEMRAVAIAWRKGQEKPTIKEFTLKDAETAGLLRMPRNRDGKEYKGTYQLYLKDMLLSRAGCRVLHVVFGAELAGCLIEGEAEDADDAAERRGEVRVAASGAESALQGVAQRLLAPPPKRDPLLDELKVARRAAPDPKGELLVEERRSGRQIHPNLAGALIEKRAPEAELVPATLVEEKTPEVQAVIDAQVEEVFGAPESACPRCKASINAMGGCDVCGWPGEDDFRGPSQ